MTKEKLGLNECHLLLKECFKQARGHWLSTDRQAMLDYLKNPDNKMFSVGFSLDNKYALRNAYDRYTKIDIPFEQVIFFDVTGQRNDKGNWDTDITISRHSLNEQDENSCKIWENINVSAEELTERLSAWRIQEMMEKLFHHRRHYNREANLTELSKKWTEPPPSEADFSAFFK